MSGNMFDKYLNDVLAGKAKAEEFDYLSFNRNQLHQLFLAASTRASHLASKLDGMQQTLEKQLVRTQAAEDLVKTKDDVLKRCDKSLKDFAERIDRAHQEFDRQAQEVRKANANTKQAEHLFACEATRQMSVLRFVRALHSAPKEDVHQFLLNAAAKLRLSIPPVVDDRDLIFQIIFGILTIN